MSKRYPSAALEPAIAPPASADALGDPSCSWSSSCAGGSKAKARTTLTQLAATFGLPTEQIFDGAHRTRSRRLRPLQAPSRRVGANANGASGGCSRASIATR